MMKTFAEIGEEAKDRPMVWRMNDTRCRTCRGEGLVHRGLMLDDITGLAVEVPFPASMAPFGEPAVPCPDCSGGTR